MNYFSDEQKAAVEKAGLGALLTLKQIKIQRELCKQIADCFDLETGEFIFRGIRIKITMKEVEHILGLPSQGEEIKEPPKIHLKDYLMSNETYGDDFIRNFVLYTIGFYLCPTLQPHVKSEYLGLIDNIENIKNLNWTSLVLNFLIASIREYKETKAANLKGNVALLQVFPLYPLNI
ncbi:hypothetical protein HU200_015119 [Digitaria exilis]|uniref:Aminotransferase-like plant mobile domain-containing protein n=1 Tax=Digitaria exilis TaxID=1010633 RepID=A0A835FAM6_9POAL|nr:hypothetical protein HU200_015119 [Digitaria exilis]